MATYIMHLVTNDAYIISIIIIRINRNKKNIILHKNRNESRQDKSADHFKFFFLICIIIINQAIILIYIMPLWTVIIRMVSNLVHRYYPSVF